MYVPSTIRLSTCRSSIPIRPMLRVTLTAGEVHDLARLIDQRAAEAEHEGSFSTAETLAWRAAALREAAR